MSNNTANERAAKQSIDLKLEVVAIPVKDVDRSKHICGRLGWRLDAFRCAMREPG